MENLDYVAGIVNHFFAKLKSEEEEHRAVKCIEEVFETIHDRLVTDEKIKWEQTPDAEKTKVLWGLMYLVFSFGEYEGLDMEGYELDEEYEEMEATE